MPFKTINMKRNQLIFWIVTILFGALMIFSGIQYFTNEQMVQGFHHLGFPDYFRIELGTAKILGACLLLWPGAPQHLRLFVYSGFAITLASAVIAHTASGDAVPMIVAPAVFLVLLIVSYIYDQKRTATA